MACSSLCPGRAAELRSRLTRCSKVRADITGHGGLRATPLRATPLPKPSACASNTPHAWAWKVVPPITAYGLPTSCILTASFLCRGRMPPLPVVTGEDGKRGGATSGITMDVNGLELRARSVYSGADLLCAKAQDALD